jgi:hypothetical protein
VSGYAGSFFDVGLGLVHWPREDIALEGAITVTGSSGGSGGASTHAYTTTDRSFGLWMGARYYLPLGQRLRPFLRGGLGPLAEFKTDHEPDGTTEYSEGTVSGWFGGGLDWQLGRHFGLTVRAGWDLRTKQKPDVTYGFTVGFTFGRAWPR